MWIVMTKKALKKHPSCREMSEIYKLLIWQLFKEPPVFQIHTPCVNNLRQDATYLSVVDINNVFFSIPVHPVNQFWFAFTYEERKFTFTRFLQGYCESPTIYF